jgi:hypothetical protein
LFFLLLLLLLFCFNLVSCNDLPFPSPCQYMLIHHVFFCTSTTVLYNYFFYYKELNILFPFSLTCYLVSVLMLFSMPWDDTWRHLCRWYDWKNMGTWFQNSTPIYRRCCSTPEYRQRKHYGNFKKCVLY